MSHLSNAEIAQMMTASNAELLAMPRQELLDLHAAIAANIAVAQANLAASQARIAQYEAQLQEDLLGQSEDEDEDQNED